MKSNQVKRLAYAGLFTALVTVATMFFKLPVPITNGYVNLGDGFIFAAGMVLGPLAGVVGAVGSALADLLAGYVHYAIVTFFIKGAMGLLVGYALKKYDFSNLIKNCLIFLVAEIIMVGGYFIFECFYYDVAAALGAVLPNAVQGVFGIIIGAICAPVLRRLPLSKEAAEAIKKN